MHALAVAPPRPTSGYNTAAGYIRQFQHCNQTLQIQLLGESQKLSSIGYKRKVGSQKVKMHFP
jgi:hypothetical protein